MFLRWRYFPVLYLDAWSYDSRIRVSNNSPIKSVYPVEIRSRFLFFQAFFIFHRHCLFEKQRFGRNRGRKERKKGRACYFYEERMEGGKKKEKKIRIENTLVAKYVWQGWKSCGEAHWGALDDAACTRADVESRWNIFPRIWCASVAKPIFQWRSI